MTRTELYRRVEAAIETAPVSDDMSLSRARAIRDAGLLAAGVSVTQAAHRLAGERLRAWGHAGWRHEVAVGMAEAGLLAPTGVAR